MNDIGYFFIGLAYVVFRVSLIVIAIYFAYKDISTRKHYTYKDVRNSSIDIIYSGIKLRYIGQYEYSTILQLDLTRYSNGTLFYAYDISKLYMLYNEDLIEICEGCYIQTS